MLLKNLIPISLAALAFPNYVLATPCQSKQGLLLSAGCDIVAEASYGAIIDESGNSEHGQVNVQ